jgi:hypothetical protein
MDRGGTVIRGLALALTALCAWLPASASAATERATLHAAFLPDRLGASTTISFGFTLATTQGLAPPPLTHMRMRMPAGINYTMTTLGLAICRPEIVLAKGLGGCSPNSRLGFGKAFVEVPFGLGTGHEIPEIQALMGPPRNGNLDVLFFVNGRTPVSAQLVFTGEVTTDSGVFGSDLAVEVPVIPSVPAGPDVSVVSVQATIGPRHLTYYRHAHGRVVPFHPVGVGIPAHCPRGGFPFAAEFSFQDGSQTHASTTVPCPHRSTKA